MLQTIALMALLTAPQVEAGCKANARVVRNHVFACNSRVQANVQVQSGVFALAVPTVSFVQPVAVQAQAVAVQAAPCHAAAAVQQTFAAPVAVAQAFTTFAVQPVAAFTVFSAVQQVAVAVPVAAVNVNVKVNQRRGLLGRIFH